MSSLCFFRIWSVHLYVFLFNRFLQYKLIVNTGGFRNWLAGWVCIEGTVKQQYIAKGVKPENREESFFVKIAETKCHKLGHNRFKKSIVKEQGEKEFARK